MPNMVPIQLQVKGNYAAIAKFREKNLVTKNGEQHLDFGAIVPMPKEFENLVLSSEGHFRVIAGVAERVSSEEMESWKTQFGATHWQEWCISNWGTKWNGGVATVQESVAADLVDLEVSFATAWAFPFPWFKKLLDQHPELEIQARYEDDFDLGLTVSLERLPPFDDEEDGDDDDPAGGVGDDDVVADESDFDLDDVNTQAIAAVERLLEQEANGAQQGNQAADGKETHNT